MMRLIPLLMFCTVLAACAVAPAPVEELPARTAAVTPVPPGYYQVRRGDTLYSIAFQFGHAYQQLAVWNHIAPPYMIYVGQRLRVVPPGTPVSAPQVRVLPAELPPVVPEGTPAGSSTPASTPPSTATPPDTVPAGPLRWTWPAQGSVLHGFNPDTAGGKGIDIGGRFGQNVTAAANGSVVYSGSGLIGYGQLVIIKHDKSLLSAYAYNRRLLVKEGDSVHGGQAIAEMGVNGAEGPVLHFEIRRDGKPVNPLAYLPRR